MKRMAITTTAMLLIISILLPANAKAGIDIFVNHNWVDIETINHKGRVLVPVRGIFEKLGYTVTYDNNTKTATISGINRITMTNGQSFFWCDSKMITPDVPQQIIDSKFYLPLRAVAEALGGDVWWSGNSVSLNIDALGDITNASIYNSQYEPPTSLKDEVTVNTQSDGSEVTVTKKTDGTEVISYKEPSNYDVITTQIKETSSSNNYENEYSGSNKTTSNTVNEPNVINNKDTAKLADPNYARQAEQELFSLINQERAKRGYPPLEWREDIAVGARKYNEDKASGTNSMDSYDIPNWDYDRRYNIDYDYWKYNWHNWDNDFPTPYSCYHYSLYSKVSDIDNAEQFLQKYGTYTGREDSKFCGIGFLYANDSCYWVIYCVAGRAGETVYLEIPTN